MGNRSAIMSLLNYADKIAPSRWNEHESILAAMDLQGDYQKKNLRTVMCALDVLGYEFVPEAIVHTAERTGFRGRWEKLSDNPLTICDIGHNEHGLRHNFAQLTAMKANGQCSDLIIVYGSVADKDVDSVLHLMPHDATYIFTQAQSKRALPADIVYEKYVQERGVSENIHVCPTVAQAVKKAGELAASLGTAPLIYIGGSTYVVSEAIELVR